MEINGAQLARLAGISRAAITKAVNTKRLKRNSNNKFDADEKMNSIFLIQKGIHKAQIEAEIKKKEKPIPEKKEKKPKKENKIKNPKERPITPKPPIGKIKPRPKKEKPKKENQASTKKEEMEINEQQNETERSEYTDDITGLPKKMLSMTIRQLISRYNDPHQIKIWAEILSKLMSANEKDQKIQEKRIELIKKDFVTSRVFSYLETLSLQLFDYPESIIDNTIAVIKSEENNARISIVNEMKNDFGQLIKEAKSNITREIDSLISKHQKENDNDDEYDN